MFICSRTPLRVSFFGGGTDYPEYFKRRKGAVIGMAINKYIYVSILPLNDLIEYKYRVSYSRLEIANTIDQIEHPVIRAILKNENISRGLDISISADLPSRSGLGSSSSFTVGMLNAIMRLNNKRLTRYDLGKLAIFVEQKLLKERVGVQDQLHASYGGLNKFEFEGDSFRISPIQINSNCLEALNNSMYLVYTGLVRHASNILDEQMTATTEKKIDADLDHLYKLVGEAASILEISQPDCLLKEMGSLLHDGWMTKKKLSSKVSNNHIDELYDAARDAGAIGGKLCGAGSGGFLLMLVPQEKRSFFEQKLKNVSLIKIEMDADGSLIIAQ